MNEDARARIQKLLLTGDNRLKQGVDPEKIRESYEQALEVAGRAGDGAEAVKLALNLRPDVTLMDIAMPVMDGLQATKQIRRQWPTACVLMLTGSNSRTDVDQAREAGAAGYVTKERISAELIEAILEIASR